ncbi:hypothetical protein AO377_1403 [Moraxella catarrhalis]|nr:hypothetical protein AO377_1403 [Moraxella catarrhalis]OAV15223.1 hypothetical protein AO375_0814 [Moraxella catarrhalis]OAV37800.1 hypothetical protein AO365_0321 [Moraxella catarrhalis]
MLKTLLLAKFLLVLVQDNQNCLLIEGVESNKNLLMIPAGLVCNLS